MPLRYNDQIITNIMNKFQNIKMTSYNNNNFSPQYPTMGIFLRDNGDKRTTNCIVDVNEIGILVILLSPFHMDEIMNYYFFKFENIQGIKIKEKHIGINITLQLSNANNYKVRLTKTFGKNLLNQANHRKNIVRILESKQIDDMKNYEYKRNLIFSKITEFAYASTLIIFELVILFFYFQYIGKNYFFIIFILVGFMLHFILYVLTGSILYYFRNRRFNKEYASIIENYKNNQDYYKLLYSLKNMKEKSKSQDKKNDYNLALSIVYYELKDQANAKKHIKEIKTKDIKYSRMIEQQLYKIENMSNES